MKIDFKKLLDSEKKSAGEFASGVNWRFLANKVGVSSQLFFYWKKSRGVPDKWIVAFEKVGILLGEFKV